MLHQSHCVRGADHVRVKPGLHLNNRFNQRFVDAIVAGGLTNVIVIDNRRACAVYRCLRRGFNQPPRVVPLPEILLAVCGSLAHPDKSKIAVRQPILFSQNPSLLSMSCVAYTTCKDTCSNFWTNLKLSIYQEVIYESICNKLLCGDFSLSGRRIDRLWRS